MKFRILVECLEKFKFSQDLVSQHSKTKLSFFESRLDEIVFEESEENSKMLQEELKNIYSYDNNSNVYQVISQLDEDVNKNFPHNFWRNFDYIIDVRLLPGQTDESGQTVNYLIQSIYAYSILTSNFIDENFNCSTIRRFYIKIEDEKFDINNIESLIEELSLDFKINSVIHSVKIINLKTHDDNKSQVSNSKEDKNLFSIDETYDLKNLDKEGLKKINQELQLGLNDDDMLSIKEHYTNSLDNPTRLILETIGQSWSEHCKHRIFSGSIDEIEDGVYREHIKKATEEICEIKLRKDGKPFCYSVFKDNAGAVELNDDYLITHKVETHNSPTALDPFGGAITGILGVNRDCLGFGLGAKPVMNTFAFNFPLPSNEVSYFRKQNMGAPQLTPNYIIQGVINGVEAGGNCSGIPTVHGATYFDDEYLAKPLVFCGTIGLIPKKIHDKNSWEKKPQNGDLIVIIGGRTGRDGIHGAIFSSSALDEDSSITHVQIGAPITQKKVLDVVLEARDNCLFNAITDNGAGGLSSSVGEMGEAGFKVNLDKVLLKTKKIKPFEIWVSESQERMTLAVSPEKITDFEKITAKHSVEMQIIGEFNNSGFGEISYTEPSGEKKSVRLDLQFLHKGAPKYKLQSIKPEFRILTEEEKNSLYTNGDASRFIKSTDGMHCLKDTGVFEKNHDSTPRDLKNDIINIMHAKNISTREEIFTTYDHTVQGGSIIQPIQGEGKICVDAGVTKPLLKDKCGVAVSSAMHPSYGGHMEDTYNMSAYSIDNVIRNLVVVGANPDKIALLDNFCWSNSFDGIRLWQLKRSTLACYDTAIAFETPYISGKDSMFNDFKGFDSNNNEINLSNLPTLLISGLGVVDDTKICVTSDFKEQGDLIYIIGETKVELGGSEYFRMIGYNGGFVPQVNCLESKKNYEFFHQLLKKHLVQSSISVSYGGIIAALNKSIIGGLSGAKFDIQSIDKCKNVEQFLFSESSGRIVFSIKTENKSIVENFLKEKDIYFNLLGEVTNKEENITLKAIDKQVIYSLDDLCRAYYRKIIS